MANRIVLNGTNATEILDVSGQTDPYEIYALKGYDTVIGTAFDDLIDGGPGQDELYGGAGNDTFLASNGGDLIDGGAGYDVILGGDGDETIQLGALQSVEEIDGGSGTNVVAGTKGSDVLDFSGTLLVNISLIDAGRGFDVITGSASDDWIMGSQGADTLFGGGGIDTAVFTGNIANYDILVDGDVVTVNDRVGTDSTDRLTGFSYLLFSDAVYDLTGGAGGTPPQAVDDIASGDEDQPIVIDVLANDSSQTGGALSLVAVGQGAHGSVTINADNTVTYQPAADFFGSDSFTYTVGDGPLNTAAATVAVTVAPLPDPPVAQDDQAVTALDTPVTIDVLGNDSDADGDSLGVSSFTQPANGTVSQNPDGTLLYTPVSGFSGSDTFTYAASDGTSDSSANVTVQVAPQAPSIADLSFRQILTSMPDEAWLQVNLNTMFEVWPSFEQRADGGNRKPTGVLGAWSSFAWDSTRGDLIVWGGGHATYPGNEVYLWHSSTLQWELASLPSEVARIEAGLYETVDGYLHSPVSAHTYDNSNYLPIVDRFMVLGGAAWNTGGKFVRDDGTTATGPYFWDPSKADGSKVGGLTGSHANPDLFPDVVGGEMWENRDTLGDSGFRKTLVNGASGYVEENGKDVVYFGLFDLWKYTINDINDPSQDTIEQVGNTFDDWSGDGAGAVDLVLNAFVRTSRYEFVMWDLNKAAPNNHNINFVPDDPSGLFDFGHLSDYGMDYDPVRDIFVLWKGDGMVWALNAPDEVSATGWTLTPLVTESLVEVPDTVGLTTGVMGKWKYVAEQDIFIGINDSKDGNVWIYKPDDWQPHNSLPELTVADVATLGLQPHDMFSLADLIDWSDADGDLLSFGFTDLNADPASGYLVLDGLLQSANQEIVVSAEQILNGDLTWTVADSGLFDDVTIRVSDPFGSAPVVTVRLPDDPANTAPDVVASDAVALPGEAVDLADLISATDSENDPIAGYQFWDAAGGGDGYLTVAGTPQSEDQWVAVADLADARFIANSGAGAARLWVQAYDGQEWSLPEPFEIATSAGV